MIHKTAIVDKKAHISNNVKIGPYCIIGPDVEIGSSDNSESDSISIKSFNSDISFDDSLKYLYYISEQIQSKLII